MAPRGISHLFLNETNHIRALTGGEIVKEFDGCAKPSIIPLT